MISALMVHGAGGGGWEWRLWADRFAADGVPVLAPDLMPSPAGLAATSLDDYRAQVLGWSKQLATPYCLLGASLGGLLALAVASQRSPAALVLINPVPPAGTPATVELPARPAIVEWSQLAFERTRAALPDAGLAAARWVHARWRDESGLALNQAAAGWPLAVLPNCPILVLAAAWDREIPPSGSKALAGHLGAEFVVLPACSHLGVLLGRNAVAAAELALTWMHARIFPENPC